MSEPERTPDGRYLGERGHAWWETPSAAELDTRIEATMRALLRHRDGSTICPSDIARVVGGDAWRERMTTVRAVAVRLRDAGQVAITQRGAPVTGGEFTGPARSAPASLTGHPRAPEVPQA